MNHPELSSDLTFDKRPNGTAQFFAFVDSLRK